MGIRDEERLMRDIQDVKLLGGRIGYGHLMGLASALWRDDLEKKGYPINGAFIPTIEDFIKDEYANMTAESKKTYDYIVKSLK